jgi:RNA:NAD 2'-phosphotransferase (TPT1/KptA family)
MDGNDDEWRILYHGTKHYESMKSIVEKGLEPGRINAYSEEICLFSKKIVGKGVYFSNQITVC